MDILRFNASNTSIYAPDEHLEAAQKALGDDEIDAAINYIEGEVVQLVDLCVDDEVVHDTLKAITSPHLDEVRRIRAHNQARPYLHNDASDKRANFITKWRGRFTSQAPGEEQIRLFLNVAMDYDDPVCARAVLPYLKRVAHTQISYAVLHHVMSQIAGQEQT